MCFKVPECYEQIKKTTEVLEPVQNSEETSSPLNQTTASM